MKNLAEQLFALYDEGDEKMEMTKHDAISIIVLENGRFSSRSKGTLGSMISLIMNLITTDAELWKSIIDETSEILISQGVSIKEYGIKRALEMVVERIEEKRKEGGNEEVSE